MTNLTISELLGTALATVCFLLVMIPPGFLLGWALDLMRFRSRSATEQLLWSVTLSLPLDLVIANVPARVLPKLAPLFLFLLLDFGTFVLIFALRRRGKLSAFVLDRRAKIVLVCLVAEAVYIVLAGMPLQFGHRIFEPVFSSDWEIRLPLIRAAVRDGVPPHNPFFTLQGASPAVQYYYYWFSLCAQVNHLAPVDARATLLASSVYAAFCLLATSFLCLKYLMPADGQLRRRCLLLLGLYCVIGLDVVASVLGFFLWRTRVRPEIEWWLPDRSPGLPGAVIYAPHHVAGAACGFLFVVLLGALQKEPPSAKWRSLLPFGITMGLAFAALVGTSTYITMFFSLMASVIFLVSLWKRQMRVPAALLMAAVFSLLCSLPYLHEIFAKTTAAPGSKPSTHLLALALRHSEYAHWLMVQLARRMHVPLPGRALRFVTRSIIIALLFFAETGFFLVVLGLQFWRDFRSETPTTNSATNLWVLVGSTGVFFAFVTSAPLQATNDLGVHAGLVLRIVFTLWGAQVVSRYMAERRSREWASWELWTVRLAGALLVLGSCSTVLQAAMERSYLALLDAHYVPPVPPFHSAHHLARLYQDVYDVQTTVDTVLPKDAVVQSNPIGSYARVVRLYQLRRQAAGDQSCEGAFGGNPAVCQSFVPSILKLFGTHGPRYIGYSELLITPSDMSVNNLASVCSQVGLAAVMASNADPVWYQADSWVWRGDLLTGNDHVRVIQCPGEQHARF